MNGTAGLIAMPMLTYEVAAAPFPYTSRPVTAHRPCLIIARPETDAGLAWVMMITSSENAPLPGDVMIDDLASAGLNSPSIVRTSKITTLELGTLRIIGSITDICAERISAAVHGHMSHRG